MNKRAVQTISLQLLLAAGMLSPQRAWGGDAPYPTMAPVEQYLMADRAAEIALARSAAPPAISAEAEVLVLGRQGYEPASPGKNGWICVVERGWMGSTDDSQFWNPKIRGPVCFNPPAARTIFPITKKRSAMILAGRSKADILSAEKLAIEKKELPALESGAMSYMMSSAQFLGDEAEHFAPHLMFYSEGMPAATWGSDQAGSPVWENPQFKGAPEPVKVIMVAVYKWSDGTPFVVHKH